METAAKVNTGRGGMRRRGLALTSVVTLVLSLFVSGVAGAPSAGAAMGEWEVSSQPLNNPRRLSTPVMDESTGRIYVIGGTAAGAQQTMEYFDTKPNQQPNPSYNTWTMG